MFSALRIWDSEADEAHDVMSDGACIMLDDDNGVLILANHSLTGNRTTSLLFFGSAVVKNTNRWGEFVAELDDENCHLINVQTKLAISQCFGL